MPERLNRASSWLGGQLRTDRGRCAGLESVNPSSQITAILGERQLMACQREENALAGSADTAK